MITIGLSAPSIYNTVAKRVEVSLAVSRWDLWLIDFNTMKPGEYAGSLRIDLSEPVGRIPLHDKLGYYWYLRWHLEGLPGWSFAERPYVHPLEEIAFRQPVGPTLEM